jgi:integrase
MSADHPTAPADSRQSGKPAKPFPDFPLFPHATGRWAKKVKGKLRYFGRWDDPAGALREYQEFLEGNPADKSRPPCPEDGKPAKPSLDFPLFPHATGQWAKKIRGKLHYFGTWDDPGGALKKYDEQKEALHAGRKPRDQAEGLTVKEMVNGFLRAKMAARDAGELSPRSWQDYKAVCDLLIAHFGKSRLVADLDPDDFADLRTKMSKTWGPVTLGNVIQRMRVVVKFAWDSGKIDRPVRYGQGFKRPTKKTLRIHRAKQGVKLFMAGEVLALVNGAVVVGKEGPELVQPGPAMRAILLLGINCGLGNNDAGTLPLSAVNLDTAWIDFPRPKTGIPRRCPLWPETVQAIRQALAARPEPKEAEDAGRVFLTKYGKPWAKDIADSPITKETRKLLDQLGIDGHRNFYSLRHTFRTIADEAKDQPAADFIMGHEIPHMSTVYRESISDERLKAVSDHVRQWLFGPTANAKPDDSQRAQP